MKGLRWLLVMSALAVAACDGGPKSPDFEAETKVTEFRIASMTATTALASIPDLAVGATEDVRALATITSTVPPGYVGPPTPVTEGGQLVVKRVNQDVTADTTWSTPEGNSKASVDGNGRITGSEIGSTTITAAYKGETDTLPVTVTDATLEGGEVLCIRPVSSGDLEDDACDQTTFSSAAGGTIEFEAIGRFSDDSIRRIGAPYVLNWTSEDTTVASKPTSTNNTPLTTPEFLGRTIGTTDITGTVVQGATPTAALPVPADATATLNVVSANAFCDSEFPSTSVITSTRCPLCDVNNEAAIIDGNIETSAELSIPLGLLLLSSISVTVQNPATAPSILPGEPAGFVVSRDSNDLLALHLLSSLEVTTLRREGTNLVPTNDPATQMDALRLTLLGIRLPSSPQFLLSTAPTTEAYDAIRLTFNGGLLSALTTLNVNTACSQVNTDPVPAP